MTEHSTQMPSITHRVIVYQLNTTNSAGIRPTLCVHSWSYAIPIIRTCIYSQVMQGHCVLTLRHVHDFEPPFGGLLLSLVVFLGLTSTCWALFAESFLCADGNILLKMLVGLLSFVAGAICPEDVLRGLTSEALTEGSGFDTTSWESRRYTP